jgi:hypothetical protein
MGLRFGREKISGFIASRLLSEDHLQISIANFYYALQKLSSAHSTYITHFIYFQFMGVHGQR